MRSVLIPLFTGLAGFAFGLSFTVVQLPPPTTATIAEPVECEHEVQLAAPTLIQRVEIPEERKERFYKLEEALTKAWARMANLEQLAYEQAPRDAFALVVEVNTEEVDQAVRRSHFIDNAEQLRMALSAVGGVELWKMFDEERDWLRTLADKSKALDQWAFNSWVDRASRTFCDDLVRRGLPFSLAEQFRLIVTGQ